MTGVFRRIFELKVKKGYTWNELAQLAGIPVATWMTGLPTSKPSDDELHALAPVLGTTYQYLKYGIE